MIVHQRRQAKLEPTLLLSSTTADRWTRLSEAAANVVTIHAKHNRKETEIPSISQVLGVARLVLEHGGDED